MPQKLPNPAPVGTRPPPPPKPPSGVASVSDDHTKHDALAFLVTAVEEYLSSPIGNTSDALVRLCNVKDRAKKALTDGVPASNARHCGNCADGVPGGPDRCSECGRNAPQYSHWTPAEIAAEEAAAAEQSEQMRRKAEDDEHALDPDDEPTLGVASGSTTSSKTRNEGGADAA